MNFFKKNALSRIKKCEDCKVKLPRKPFYIKIFGEEYKFIKARKCPSCFEKYMNENSTVCNACGKPIMPFSRVAVALPKNNEEPKYPYVHFSLSCNPLGGLAFCGDWEEGKLVGIEEMEQQGKISKK